MFEQEFESFLRHQRSGATDRRREMLSLDLTGTKKLLEVVVWPVLRSFEGVTLEFELSNSTGVTMYIDVFYEPLGIALECDGFVSHAEKITRSRFDFERTRARTMATKGLIYMPYSKDQLDKQPDFCRQSMYELLGKQTSIAGRKVMEELSVSEREVIRYGLHLNRALKLDDVRYCLGCGYIKARKVINDLVEKSFVKAAGNTTQRIHKYQLLPIASEYMLGKF